MGAEHLPGHSLRLDTETLGLVPNIKMNDTWLLYTDTKSVELSSCKAEFGPPV